MRNEHPIKRLLCWLGWHDHQKGDVDASQHDVRIILRCSRCGDSRSFRYFRWELGEPAAYDGKAPSNVAPCWPDYEGDERELRRLLDIRDDHALWWELSPRDRHDIDRQIDSLSWSLQWRD